MKAVRSTEAWLGSLAAASRSRCFARSGRLFDPLRFHWGVLHVRFDHPEGLVHTTRDLGEQVDGVGVIQRCRIIDGLPYAPAKRRERILHRLHVGAPVTDLEGIFAEL